MSCVICTEPLYNNDSVCASPCGHCLHHKCWKDCLDISLLCPVCRKPTRRQQLIRLYLNTDDDDEITSYAKRIDILNYQLAVFKREVKSAEEKVCSEQTMNTSLREQLERSEEKAETALKNLCSLRQELEKERQDKKNAIVYREKFRSMLKSIEDSNDKKRNLRQILGVSKQEADKLRSEILTLKMGAGQNPSPAWMSVEARKFQRALEALDENMNNLHERLQE